MRATVRGEPGYADQAMVCCGHFISFEVTREQGIAYAVWTCPSCGREAHFCLGEPNAEKAEVAHIGLDEQGAFNYYAEAQ